jgi:hypothetical protein
MTTNQSINPLRRQNIQLLLSFALLSLAAPRTVLVLGASSIYLFILYNPPRIRSIARRPCPLASQPAVVASPPPCVCVCVCVCGVNREIRLLAWSMVYGHISCYSAYWLARTSYRSLQAESAPGAAPCLDSSLSIQMEKPLHLQAWSPAGPRLPISTCERNGASHSFLYYVHTRIASIPFNYYSATPTASQRSSEEEEKKASIDPDLFILSSANFKTNLYTMY